jgi:hypothetical protein
MFIKIQNKRVRISSIGEYEAKGEAISNKGHYYLNIKISGKERSFVFTDEQEYQRVVDYLDKTLKVEFI